MFATHRIHRAASVALLVSAGLLGSAVAFAQQRQIDIRWSPQTGLGTSFDIALQQRAEGKLRAAVVPTEPGIRGEGQRSALRHKAGDLGLQMSFSTLLRQKSATGAMLPKGLLGVQVDARGPAIGGTGGGDIVVLDILDSATGQSRAGAGGGGGGGGDILVFDIVDSAIRQSRACCSGGDIIIFDVIDSAIPAAMRIRIDARPDQQLEGSAAHWQWFNRPGPGEPLVATIPALMPGQMLNTMLEIRDVLKPGSAPLQMGLRFQF